MNKKHIVGYGLTAIGCLGIGIGLAGSDNGVPQAATVSTETVTVTASVAAPTPAEATVTVNAPAMTQTHTVTQTAEAATETVTETVTAQPPEPESAFRGDGIYEVGTDIEPGTYVADAGDGCYWARLSGSDGFDSIITNHFGAGQTIVTIKASDRFFETSGCGTWSVRE